MENTVLNQIDYPILSIIVFIPLIGAALLLFIKNATAVRWFSLFVTCAGLAAALPIIASFDKTTPLMQFQEAYEWIPAWGINYFIGIDGISVFFIFLTLLLSILSVLVSWKSVETKVKEFHIALLVMETAILGVFAALDFFLFYIFIKNIILEFWDFFIIYLL